MARRRTRKNAKAAEVPTPPRDTQAPSVGSPSQGSARPAPPGGGLPRGLWILGLLVLAGVGLRVAAMFGELWFDEFWTVQLIEQKLEYIWDVFRIDHDNNHFLNTLVVFFIGSDQPFWTYRVHSVLAGLGSIVLASLLLRPLGRAEALMGAALTAVSYPLVLYGSECRGYGMFILFSLASVVCLERFLSHRSWLWATLGGLAAACAVLAHLTFFFVAGAMVVRVAAGPLAWTQRTAPPTGSRETWRSLCTSLPLVVWPLVAVALVRLLMFPDFELGGSDRHTSVQAGLQVLSMLSGGPDAGWLMVLPALSSVLLIGTGLWGLARDQRGRLAFFAGILITPIAFFLWRTPKSVFLRSLLGVFVFLLLLCAISAVQLWRRGGWRRALVVLWLLMFCLGNARSLAVLLRNGRAQYAPALALMARESPGAAIRICSDHDFRHGHLLSFHHRYLPEGKQVSYFPMDRWPRPSPQWYLSHSVADLPVPPDSVDILGSVYRLRRNCQPPPLSGWAHFVYELESSPPE